MCNFDAFIFSSIFLDILFCLCVFERKSLPSSTIFIRILNLWNCFRNKFNSKNNDFAIWLHIIIFSNFFFSGYFSRLFIVYRHRHQSNRKYKWKCHLWNKRCLWQMNNKMELFGKNLDEKVCSFRYSPFCLRFLNSLLNK